MQYQHGIGDYGQLHCLDKLGKMDRRASRIDDDVHSGFDHAEGGLANRELLSLVLLKGIGQASHQFQVLREHCSAMGPDKHSFPFEIIEVTTYRNLRNSEQIGELVDFHRFVFLQQLQYLDLSFYRIHAPAPSLY